MPCTQTGSLEGDAALAAESALAELNDTNTKLTQMLCAMCRVIDGSQTVSLPAEVEMWWRKHKAQDAKAQAARAEEEATSGLHASQVLFYNELLATSHAVILPVDGAAWRDVAARAMRAGYWTVVAPKAIHGHWAKLLVDRAKVTVVTPEHFKKRGFVYTASFLFDLPPNSARMLASIKDALRNGGGNVWLRPSPTALAPDGRWRQVVDKRFKVLTFPHVEGL